MDHLEARAAVVEHGTQPPAVPGPHVWGGLETGVIGLGDSFRERPEGNGRWTRGMQTLEGNQRQANQKQLQKNSFLQIHHVEM